MTHTKLLSESRTIKGRKTDALRADGKFPAVMYGFGTEPVNITIDRNAFLKAYKESGMSTVLDLDVNGTTHPVLIAAVQREPLNDFVRHADFRRVDLTHKIEAKIPFKLAGISSAVKDLGGTLIQSLVEIEVICLPNALVHNITVDVSALKTFDDVIRVSDIVVSKDMEILTPGDTPIVSVQPPRSEEEMAALDAAVDGDVSKVEVTTEVKKEEGAADDKGKKEAKKK